jgi:mono/diheme cytochrome c family protein
MFKLLAFTSLGVALLYPVFALPANAAPSASSKNVASVQAGQKVFTQNCFSCHSTNAGQVKVGPSLYHVNSGPKPRRTATEIRSILQNGKKGDLGQMPPFKDVLSKTDTDNLLAYVHTL